MTAPQPPTVARHILPYLVAAVLVGVASGATWMVTGRKSAQPVTKKANNPAKQTPHVERLENTEPIVGFLLPAKSKIGSIGTARGIKGALFGRKSDLEKALSNPLLSGTLEVNLGQDTGEPDKLSGLKPVPETTSVDLAPGHVLIQLSSAQQFLKLVEESQNKAQNEHVAAPTGGLTFDAMGKSIYVIGFIDSIEVDAAPEEQLDVRFPNGSIHLTAPK